MFFYSNNASLQLKHFYCLKQENKIKPLCFVHLGSSLMSHTYLNHYLFFSGREDTKLLKLQLIIKNIPHFEKVDFFASV
jgi:hypothetical protein